MQTFRDNVIVKLEEQEETSKGGILLPTSVKEGFTKGEVIAVGEGYYNEKTGNTTKLTVVVGDTVLINYGTGIELEKNLILIREADIFGIVE